MKYFLHDSNAFNDEKITQLFMEFGYEGLGLFYTLLEKLAMQEKPIKTEVLKKQLFVGKKLERCWQFMESLGIISSNNGETFNKQLLNFSEKYQIKKEKNAERISQWRKNQEVIENVTRNESVRNTPKEKISKVNRSKEKEIDSNTSECDFSEVLIYPTFDDFWNLYDKKRGREKSEKLWQKLDQKTREEIMQHLPEYIQSTPDEKYRKDPATFLNNKSWNDAIIKPTNGQTGKQQNGNSKLSAEYLADVERRLNS